PSDRRGCARARAGSTPTPSLRRSSPRARCPTDARSGTAPTASSFSRGGGPRRDEAIRGRGGAFTATPELGRRKGSGPLPFAGIVPSRPMGNLRVCVAAAIVVSACGPSGSVLDFDAGADGGRIDAPDKCPPTPPPMCDVFLSCGCAPGQKCTSAQVGLGCMNAGSKQVGQDCANDTECAPGTVCLLYGAPPPLLPYCDVLHECKQGNTACYVGVNDREVPPVVVATVCGPTCSLLDQDCHIVGQACYPSPDVYPVAERGTCRPS